MTVAVFGAKGRLGKKVMELAAKRHKTLAIDIGEGCIAAADFDGECDVVIDFSCAAATSDVCEFCLRHNCPLVTGVTGRNEAQQRQIDELGKRLPVVAKANFSVGVELLRQITQLAANLADGWDCEIVEIHRKGKADAPSGTAKMLASAACEGKSFGRVTVHSLRCGSNFGRHSVIFATEGESVTLTHQAENAEIFAKGALLQAEKLAEQHLSKV